MATNMKRSGDALLYANTSGSAINSGDVVEFGTDAGGFAGVALVDIPATTGTGVVDVSGIVEVTKATGASTGGTQGALVYWTGSAATAVAGTDHLMGYLAETVADGVALCKVKLGG